LEHLVHQISHIGLVEFYSADVLVGVVRGDDRIYFGHEMVGVLLLDFECMDQVGQLTQLLLNLVHKLVILD